MNEAKLVYSFDGQDALGHVELCDILGERVVLDQPGVRSDSREPGYLTHMVIRSPPGKNSMTKYKY